MVKNEKGGLYMKYKLSKKIIKKVIIKESQRTNIPVKIIPLTTSEKILYIIKGEFENKRNDNSIKWLDLPKNMLTRIVEFQELMGDYDYTKDIIIIFLSEIEKCSPSKGLYLLELLETVYHEYNHKLLWSKNQTEKNLENFILLMENLSMKITNIYENSKHDAFYEEIIANVYSIEKSNQFLKKYPHIYKNLKGYLKNDKLKYQIELVNYDLEKFINYVTKIIKNKKEKEFLFQTSYPYKIVGILYNKDRTFKILKTLEKDTEWTSLSMEIKYTVVASKSYLKELNLNTLSQEELNFILESLNYSYQKSLETEEKNKILRKQIKTFNKEDLPSLDYGEDLLPLLTTKEKRNRLKLKYLELQINKVTLLLEQRQNTKQKIKHI